MPLLVNHFLKKYSAVFGKDIHELSSYALEVLMNYDFPGNVRELENIIERGVALESSNIILPESLSLSTHRQDRLQQEQPPQKLTPEPANEPEEEEIYTLGLEEVLAAIEKKLIRQALQKSGNSKMRAAELLKISFRSLRYKVQKYNIEG
ncbi:helix-turn-helix domain-containing protein [Thermodesulfobacteriota bacterium]